MFKQKGFTLIELMIATTIIMILISAVVAVTQGHNQGNTISYGVNGMTEMRCIDGYKFIIASQGQTRQVMDEFGKGVKCQ